MNVQVWDSEDGWKSWSAVILASVGLHGLLLMSVWLWSLEAPRPRRVVTVEAICLTTGSGHAGGAGKITVVKPQIKPQPPPPKPEPVKKRPRPKRVREVPRPPETPPHPALSMPRPVAAAPVRPAPVAAVPTGSGSGRGEGAGSGQGAGPGSGAGTGSGPGSYAGSGSGSGNALKRYLAEVRRRLEKEKNYPWMARRQHREGVVILKFTIGNGGEIAGYKIARSSGHEVLDGAAAEALKKVGRFPPLPPVLGRSQINIQVPLAFRLSEY